MKIVDTLSGSLILVLGLARTAAADDLGPQQNPLPPTTQPPAPAPTDPPPPPPPSPSTTLNAAPPRPPAPSTTVTAASPLTPTSGPLPLSARETPTASGGPGDPASSVAGPGG